MKTVVTFEPIGYTRSNILVKIPLRVSTPGLEVFLNAFLIDDLVDIFCMVEFLVASKYTQNNDLNETFRLLGVLFYELEKETYFGELLKTCDLALTAARFEIGKNLVLPQFRP